MTDAQKLVDKAAEGMKTAGKVMTVGVTLPLIAAGAAAFKMASDFNESLNKVEVAFGYASSGVKEWSKTTLESFGIAQGTALDLAAGYGDMATSMGMSKNAAAEMSKSMVGLAGDMASFKNMNIAEVNTALTAVFTGETESLKRMGIVMTQVNLEAFAMSQGIKTQIKDMTQAELVQLRYNYVLANTANAQGDFERTGGGAANQMRIFTESVKEVGASIGQNLIPVITPGIKQLNSWIQAFGELNPEAQKTVLIVAGMAAAAGPLMYIVGSGIKTFTAISTAITAYKTATAAATVAQGGLNAAMLANPAGLVIAGIAALIVIVTTLIVLFNKAKNEEKAMFDAMIENNRKAGEAARAEIEKTYGNQMSVIDDKMTAETAYTAEVMALNQKSYDDEMAKGQKKLSVMKDNLSERQKLLDDNYNKTVDLINAEYGVYEKAQKSKLDLINEEQEKAVQAQKDILTAAEDTYNKAIENLRSEYGVYEETHKSMVDIAKQTAADKIQALNDSYAKAKEDSDSIKNLINETYRNEVDEAKKAYNEKAELLDAEYAKKLKIIDLGLSEEVKALRDQIEGIDAVTKAEEKALRSVADAKKVASLEAKIMAETDFAERSSLQQELQDLLAEIARKQVLETRELEKTALEDRIKEAQKRAEEEKAALKETHDEEKTQLETALETELLNIEASKKAKLAAEDEKLAKLKTRIDEETIKINTALEGELTVINKARLEKEAAEKAKYEAVKSATDNEIIKINEAAAVAKEKNEEIRAAKEAAEIAKYNAAKKSLDDEAAYLDTWIDTAYKTALDDKLKLANEKEAERHSKIMANLAIEAQTVKSNEAAEIAASDKAFKLAELDIKIKQKQAEIERGSNGAFGPVASNAYAQKELENLKRERALLATGSSGLPGGLAKVNSYAVGTPYVPYDQLAYIHKGEKITPASQNRGESRTADVYIQIDGQTIIRAIGQPLVDTIRSRTGIKA